LCSCCAEFLRTQVDVEDESPSAVKEKAVLYETTPALAREQACPPKPKPNHTLSFACAAGTGPPCLHSEVK
jgi:hypothetical protein